MAQYEGSYPGKQAREVSTMEDISGWAIGITFFACIMMMMIGSFHIISGLAAIFDDKFYSARPANYAFDLEPSTWGWIQLIGGTLVMICGALLMTGNTLARIVTLILLVASIIGSFVSIPYYPVWSILIIALDIATIWAITVYGRFAKAEL
jgi:hypothetical protein